MPNPHAVIFLSMKHKRCLHTAFFHSVTIYSDHRVEIKVIFHFHIHLRVNHSTQYAALKSKMARMAQA